ncbi:MAG: phage holin family protein [Pseudomonadota bacterium]
MLDEDEVSDAQTDAPVTGDRSEHTPPPPASDESILEELGMLIDDAGLYASAELAFQKTRAKLAGKNLGIAAAAIIVAIILLHIALIALAVGIVIALEPLVTIWGAIAIVVGVMLAGVIWLGFIALSRGRLLGELFSAAEPTEQSEDSAS